MPRRLAYTLIAIGFCAVAIGMIALAGTIDVGRSAIKIDVDTLDPDNPTAGIGTILTDASGAVIPPRWTGDTPCIGLCGKGVSWRYEWAPSDLKGHDAPFTIAVVLQGKIAAETTVDNWADCDTYSWMDEPMTVRCWRPPSVWYETDLAKALLLTVACVSILKFIAYWSFGLRDTRSWLGIAAINAIGLPCAWMAGFALYGLFGLLCILVVLALLDAYNLRTTKQSRAARGLVAALAAIGTIVLGCVFGSIWDLIMWFVVF